MQKSIPMTAASFGAAIAALGIATDLQADIVDLSFNPTTNATGGLDDIDINEVPGSVDFSQWNDGVGKTLYGAGTLVAVAPVSLGQVLDPATFTGGTSIAFSASASGTGYVGFLTASGNVGWFSLDLGGFLGTITYLEGQYGNLGESVTVPAPAALSLLALGAAGLGRTRKRVA